MAEVTAEYVIWVDADGQVTDDRQQAVRAEAVREFADGTVESTLADLASGS